MVEYSVGGGPLVPPEPHGTLISTQNKGAAPFPALQHVPRVSAPRNSYSGSKTTVRMHKVQRSPRKNPKMPPNGRRTVKSPR